MSAVNHDAGAGAGAGASLAARTVAAATAAAKQLGMVLGIAQQSPPPPPQGPPPPPSSIVTAPSVEGLQAVIEELVIAKDEKKGKDCEPEEERAAASNDRRSEPAEVKPENGKVEEEREKKAGKDKGSNGNPFPRRPGERDCTFFVRTGKCAYGQSCKFNHPPDRWKKNRAQRQGMPEPYQVSSANVVGEDKECRKVEKLKCKNFASPGGCKYGNASIYAHYVEKVEAEIELNFLGLPIRPGEKECTLYMEAGTCKDSTNCKYHHPNPTAFDGSDQPSEFSSSSTALLSDYGNASWVSQSTSHGLHPPPVDASFLHLQVMPAVNQVPPSNNDWHIYQASIDPCLINGVRQSLAVPASDVATKHHVDGKDYINATNDCKRNEDFFCVSTPAFMNEGKGGGNPSPVAATMAAGKAARSANHLPVSNANSATPKKGNGKHNPVGGMSDNNKGKRTGKMSTRPLLSVSPEATIGKKKERQPPSANPNNVTKNSGVDKLVSIPKYVPKEQGKEQPAVSGHNGNTEGMTSKNETISYHVPKGTEVGKKPQGDIQYDGANMKESEEQPINGKGNENNPTKISGNEIRPAKSKKNEKHSPVANAHYVPKDKTKEEQHHISTNHDDSGGKGKKPQGGIRYDGTNMKEYEEKTIKSKENESNPTKISGNESRPTKSKKSEKHSPVANAHYVPKGKSKEEQHPVSTHHDEFSGKGNGNHHAVATPIISVSAKKNIKHPPVATSHDLKNLNPCGKYSPVGVSASDAIINKYTTGKPSDDVILSDVAERTDSTKSKQPTQSTELRRRPGQRECPYYLKKGGCKYNSCKFDHPMDLNHIEISSNCVLSPKGLPLRPGIPVCTYYRQNGICKYGPVCKFDHPVNVITCDTVSK